MLSQEKIIEAINSNEIEISISFCYDKGKFVFCENEQKLLESPLKDNLYSDRLKLTMGPIIKVLNRKKIKSKYRFKSLPDCFDLRKSDNKYVINPGESITVLTNEKIKLNGKYACIVIPRISLSDVGIVVTTAYVDPYYQGVMRLHLSNLSDQTYELSSLEAIAQCFFFELSDNVSEVYKDEFSTKSVFFGQTWKGILESDRDPFPIKKQSVIVDKFLNLKKQMDLVGSFIKQHSLIFVFITNLVVILGGYAAFKQEFMQYTAAMQQIEDFLEPTASEIVINTGELYGEKEIIVPYEKSDIVSILSNNDEIQYKILSSDVKSETKIVFSYTLSSTLTENYEVNFTYVIIRRIK